MADLLLLSRWLDAVPGFLASRAPAGARIGFVPTASSIYRERDWVDLDRRTLRGQGFTTSELDAEGMSASSFADALDRVDAVFVSGGNVFHLLGTLHRTGIDDVLIHAVRDGLPYLGVSAGAAIAGSDIGPLAAFDDPHETKPLESTKALGFVDAVIVPHADGIVGGTARIDEMARRHAGHTLLYLRDDQALQVTDGTRTLLDT